MEIHNNERFVGERLSIVIKGADDKAPDNGIINAPDYQIVFSDTPSSNQIKLQESMVQVVETAFQDTDVILYITDVVEKIGKNPEYRKAQTLLISCSDCHKQN